MVLENLISIIKSRKRENPRNSYTANLFEQGLERCCQKFGEESVELIISILKDKKDEAKEEAADVLFHYLVLLESNDISFDEVLSVLKERMKVSGYKEKLGRVKKVKAEK